jgi:hypothetical protein
MSVGSSLSHTATASGSPSATTEVVTGVTGGSTTATTKYLSAGFSGTSANTGSPVGTAVTVPTSDHTHTLTAAGNVTLYDTATSGGILFVPSAQTVSPTIKYLTASGEVGTASGTATVASSSHTHNTTATGSVSLSLADNSATGKVGVITAITGASGTTKYLTASTGSPSATTDVAANGHTHTVSATGNVSLGLNDTASGGTALITTTSSGSVGGSAVLNNTGTSGIKYLQEAAHTHIEASVSNTGSAVTGISGGTTTATTKYIKVDK